MSSYGSASSTRSAGSAGSGCHSDKFPGYLQRSSVPTLPTVPASAHVHPFRAGKLDFTGRDIAAPSPSIAVGVGGSNSYRTMHISPSTPALPVAAGTDNHKAAKNKRPTTSKLANGKRWIPLSTKNVYSSTAAGGKGMAKVGGGGVPAGACTMM